ncbi:MAG: PD-(D/E)XK nuclease family protein [Candidatus Latescibacterota bacterium]
MKVLKNKFSWSVSRDRCFLECARKYYFNYYGHWGGWERGAAERTRNIYILKQLKNMSIWVGEVVHDCIARSLQNVSRGIPTLPLAEILAITRDRMRQDFRSSRAKKYWQNPKANCGFFEHEYELDVPDEDWKNSAEQVDQCLTTFYQSPHFREFKDLQPSAFLEIEQFSSFPLHGIDINIKLDCAYRKNDRIVIWDWKTGKSVLSGGSLQMACYTYYAMNTFTVSAPQVTAILYDLYQDTIHEQIITQRSLAELVTYIEGSIKDMMALLTDPQQNTASENAFAKAESRPVCLRCNFLKVCQPDI